MNRNRCTPGLPPWVLRSLTGLLAPAANGWAETETGAETKAGSETQTRRVWREPGAVAPGTSFRKASMEEARPSARPVPNNSALVESASRESGAKFGANATGRVAADDRRGQEGFDRIFDKMNLNSKQVDNAEQVPFKQARHHPRERLSGGPNAGRRRCQ